jgi:hypothetical protein
MSKGKDDAGHTYTPIISGSGKEKINLATRYKELGGGGGGVSPKQEKFLKTLATINDLSLKISVFSEGLEGAKFSGDDVRKGNSSLEDLEAKSTTVLPDGKSLDTLKNEIQNLTAVLLVLEKDTPQTTQRDDTQISSQHTHLSENSPNVTFNSSFDSSSVDLNSKIKGQKDAILAMFSKSKENPIPEERNSLLKNGFKSLSGIQNKIDMISTSDKKEKEKQAELTKLQKEYAELIKSLT